MAKIIFGLTGEIASGKGTASKYLTEKYNCGSYRFSTIIRDIVRRLHLVEDRGNMQKLSTILRENFGEDTLARAMAEDIKQGNYEMVVLDGVRRLDDIKHVQDLPGFKLIYIDANIEKRFERIIQRGENKDDTTKTFESFVKDHEAETERQIKALKDHADFVIDNNGEVVSLHNQIDEIIKKI